MPAVIQVGLVLAWTCAHATPKLRAARLALPDGNPFMVRVGEVPGVMSKSWVFPPHVLVVWMIVSSKHRASLGALIKAKETDAVRSGDWSVVLAGSSAEAAPALPR